jgi:murein DD-endopeptidase MepM/ murein hydrolase activator NlpD
MNNYFVVELAHSLHGQVKRIEVTHKALLYLVSAIILLSFAVVGLASSYLQMTWRVSQYNALRTNFDNLRNRYWALRRESKQHSEQMASLETLAAEVSHAYGLRQPDLEEGAALDSDTDQNVKESIEQYNFLRAASFSGIYHNYSYQWHTQTLPALWPVNGVVRSSFGSRTDPFSGEGAFHTGIDLAANSGTPVHVTADGVVHSTEWSGRYGKLVVIDHGRGVQTYYAHLSQFLVVPGEEVRSGQVVALSGGTGRVTSPHLHYEIRLAGTPVNPYKYLAHARTEPTPLFTRTPSHAGDFGL